MKTIWVLLLSLTLLTGCVTFVPKVATHVEEHSVQVILQEAGYVLQPGSVEYYTKTFDKAEFYYGKAFKDGTLGWFVIDLSPSKTFIEKPVVYWSVDGDFPGLELDMLINPN